MAEGNRTVKCPFCKYAEPFIDREAVFVIAGISVCEEHVDTADSSEAFGTKLYTLQLEGTDHV